MKKVIFLLTLILALLALSIPEVAQACSAAAIAAKSVKVQNQNIVLVWFSGLKHAARPPEMAALAEKYIQPGLYSLDDSQTPLWTIERKPYEGLPSFGDTLLVTANGDYLIGLSDSTLYPAALSFYHKGQLIYKYSHNDFYAEKIPYRCTHKWFKEVKLHEEQGVLEVKTVMDNTLYFNIYTGESAVPVREFDFFLVVWTATSFLILGIIWFRRRHRKAKPQSGVRR
jgi:hypothetical protein